MFILQLVGSFHNNLMNCISVFYLKQKIPTFQVIIKGKWFLGGHSMIVAPYQHRWPEASFMLGPQAGASSSFLPVLKSLPQLPHTEHHLLCYGICPNCGLHMGCLSSSHEAPCLPCFSFEVLPVWQEWDTASLRAIWCRLNLRFGDTTHKEHRDMYLRTVTH